MTLEKNPDQARQYAQRFLSRFRQSPEVSAATALLASAYERGGLRGQAKDVLQRLATRPEFAGKGSAFDPGATPAGGGGAIANVAEWALQRLAGPQFQRAASAAVLALGDGKLTSAWTATAHEQSVPLMTVGTVPQAMRRNLFYLEQQNELAVLSGTDRGKELWVPRPKLPADCLPKVTMDNQMRLVLPQQNPTGFWAEHLLLVAGAKEVVAYDSNDKGKVVWRKELRTSSGAPQPSQLQVGAGRLVIAYLSGMLSVIDAMTGEELWTQDENAPIFGSAALGDGFVAVAVQNPSRIIIHELETGARRAVVEAPGNVTSPPAAQGDQLYFVERNSLLKAIDATTGKLVWEQEAGATVGGLKAGGDLLVIVTEGRHVTALSATGKGERKKWAPVLPPGATVNTVLLDGEDLYVTANVPSRSNAPQQKLTLLAYSVAEEGKFKWDVELASDPINAVPLSPQTITMGHLLVTQSVWDPTGDKPTAVTLVARKTGLTT
ncbi:MAG: PQQ-like beta-propeller repeat protein, partial [Planctomycetota bacterium]|nr:PQQ-like beta-propeller repeat protein [Planctomycetota bacterium]